LLLISTLLACSQPAPVPHAGHTGAIPLIPAPDATATAAEVAGRYEISSWHVADDCHAMVLADVTADRPPRLDAERDGPHLRVSACLPRDCDDNVYDPYLLGPELQPVGGRWAETAVHWGIEGPDDDTCEAFATTTELTMRDSGEVHITHQSTAVWAYPSAGGACELPADDEAYVLDLPCAHIAHLVASPIP